MERTRFIEHRGRRILLQDFTNVTDAAEALAAIEAAIEFVDRLPADRSLLVLTETHGSHYDSEVLAALKRLAAHHTPYVKASAVVTSSRLHRIAVMMVSMFTGRSIEAFPDAEVAKDWLVDQAD